jgi:hypothetical protein
MALKNILTAVLPLGKEMVSRRKDSNARKNDILDNLDT